MDNFLTRIKERTRSWTVKHANGKHAQAWLAGVAFSEASFFPIPPDILLIAMLLTSSRHWIFQASWTTTFSVLGAIFGYIIGFFLFQTVGGPLVNFYHLESEMMTVGDMFSDNAFVAVFLAAFTPIPFKVFTISAGLFNVNFLVFVLAALFGRGTRFFAIGYILRRYGSQIGSLVYKYFNIFSLIIAIFIFGIILINVLL
ncbi:MAG: DedA family protein [Candidatus Pacebacteria bacterium]|nr:DedA family protein [Candidatus Paceibacterota bacterium]